MTARSIQVYLYKQKSQIPQQKTMVIENLWITVQQHFGRKTLAD